MGSNTLTVSSFLFTLLLQKNKTCNITLTALVYFSSIFKIFNKLISHVDLTPLRFQRQHRCSVRVEIPAPQSAQERQTAGSFCITAILGR